MVVKIKSIWGMYYGLYPIFNKVYFIVDIKITTSTANAVVYKTKFLLTHLIIFFVEIGNAIMASSTSSYYLLISVGGMLYVRVFTVFGAVLVIFFKR